MRVAAVVPTKGDAPENVERVVAALPMDVEPWVLWWQRPVWSDELARARMQATTIPIMNGRWAGVGLAYREGFARILRDGSYSHCLMYDSDGDMDAATVPAMIEKARGGCDLVVASRWANEGRFEGYDWRKLLVNGLGNVAFKLALRTELRDLTFGFKLLSTPLLARLLPRLEAEDHGIYAETTMLPVAMGARCCEVPTVWRGRREGVATLPTTQAARVYLRAGLRALGVAYGLA